MQTWTYETSPIAWDFRQTCDEVPLLGERIQAIIDTRS